MKYSNPRLSIVGGGQLGKMLAQEAKKMGFYVMILDPTPNSPAAQVADHQVVAGFYDRDKIKELVTNCDFSTYEIEHIDVTVLKELQKQGHIIHPSPQTLEIIQNKARQKEFLQQNNIPTAPWRYVKKNLKDEVLDFGLPAVQKSCRGGYDGRGVFVIHNEKDLENALKSESFLEELIDVEKELAVIAARDIRGDIRCFPVTEMTFDAQANICDMCIAPARIGKEVEQEALKIASKCLESLEGVGVFGIEMFLSKDGRVLVNEIAPRPHNSGHFTIEACITSQFEQHLRAVSGLPLGSPDLLTPAVMVNLLGSEGFEGEPSYIGVDEVLAIPGASLHIYGKKTTKPFRKMGHVTVVDKTVEAALQKALTIKQTLKVIARG